MALDRLIVFVDYQNVYKGARRAFDLEDRFYTHGQVDPHRVGRHIAARHPSYQGASLRRLQQVRVYRGLPSNDVDPKGYGAARRQHAKWDASGCVGYYRPLRYPHRHRKEGAEEKGIDVKIAIDLVRLALDDEYDVAVVFSADTDLLPALEMAHERGKVVEVAAWVPERGHANELSPASHEFITWSHRLARTDYHDVADQTDYVIGP